MFNNPTTIGKRLCTEWMKLLTSDSAKPEDCKVTGEKIDAWACSSSDREVGVFAKRVAHPLADVDQEERN